ncbi:MAG: hypothetical protein JO031_00925 [Ktedonobacteraceae bacterium]|nr:hypothetical protein [Ktedonobacteraceae bacterium]
MTETSANDLERVELELSRIARDYTTASQELDQYVITLEGAVSQVIEAGPHGWKGLSCEAFIGAWLERKTRMQQASLLMNEAASHLSQLARVIEDNVPLIRAEQSIQLQPVFQSMNSNDQQLVLESESQAQQSILMALSALNGQLEQLGEEIGDCPQEDKEAGEPWYERNINRNDVGEGAGGEQTPEQRIKDAVGDAVIAQELMDLAKQKNADLEDVAQLLEKGLDSNTITQLFENGTDLKDALYLLDKEIEPDVVTKLINNKADLKDIGINVKTLLDGKIRVKLVNGWLKNGTHLGNAIAIMKLGVDLNLLGTGPVGDFTGLEGATVNEVVSRIPEDAVIEGWTPLPGRTEEGMKFNWADTGGNR